MLRALVVDDDRDNADLLVEMLQLEGIDAHAAYRGLQALDRLLSERWDVLLVDYFMPDMTGEELLVRAKEAGRLTCPAFIISASPQRINAIRLHTLCAEIIPKPYELDVLTKAIHRHGMIKPLALVHEREPTEEADHLPHPPR